MQIILLFLILLCSNPTKQTNQKDEYVDIITLNHFYDLKGKLIYEQAIFWEIDPATRKRHVRAWCIIEDHQIEETRRPTKNCINNTWVTYWYDTDQLLHRKIITHIYEENWTQVDPERENKKILDERLRISLVTKKYPLKSHTETPPPTLLTPDE